MLRVENLIRRDLYSTTELQCWKSTYYILEDALKHEQPYDHIDTSNVLAVKILLIMEEYIPPPTGYRILCHAVTRGHIGAQLSDEVLSILLADQRIQPITEDEDPLVLACRRGQAEAVRLLLEDGRLLIFDWLICAAEGYTEVVKLLLEDRRFNPSDNDSSAIAYASNLDTVKLLLADGRADPTVGDYHIIISACSNGEVELLELLLQDKRVDPQAGWIRQALIGAADNGHSSILRVLFSDRRIDLSYDLDEALLSAVKKEHNYFARTLLELTHFKPTNKILKCAIRRAIDSDMISLLVSHPEVNLTEDNYRLLREACHLGIRSVVDVLLSHPSITLSRGMRELIHKEDGLKLLLNSLSEDLEIS